MNVDWGKFDWAGVAAIGAVIVTIVTAAANGYIARDRWKRVERLASMLKDVEADNSVGPVVRGMLYSEVQRLDYQLRATGYRVVLVVGWVARVAGWLAIFASYLAASTILQPWLRGDKTWGVDAWREVAPAVFVLAAPGAVLVAGSIMVFNGYFLRRQKWIDQKSPLAVPN